MGERGVGKRSRIHLARLVEALHCAESASPARSFLRKKKCAGGTKSCAVGRTPDAVDFIGRVCRRLPPVRRTPHISRPLSSAAPDALTRTSVSTLTRPCHAYAQAAKVPRCTRPICPSSHYGNQLHSKGCQAWTSRNSSPAFARSTGCHRRVPRRLLAGGTHRVPGTPHGTRPRRRHRRELVPVRRTPARRKGKASHGRRIHPFLSIQNLPWWGRTRGPIRCPDIRRPFDASLPSGTPRGCFVLSPSGVKARKWLHKIDRRLTGPRPIATMAGH